MQRTIDGLAVFEHGERARLPVILIHGFPYSSTMWRNQVQKLKETFYCITYDVRGLGQSPAGHGQHTIEGFVDDLFGIMDALGVDRAVVGGFSMGGYIALRAAERAPDRFRGLIFCDTKSEADNDAGKLKRAELIKAIDTEGIDSFAAGFVPITFAGDAPSRIPDVYNTALQEAKSQDPLGVKGCLLAMAARTDTTASLSAISVPVLIVVGEKDSLTPVQVMQAMQEKIQDAELLVVPGAGHMAPVENPGPVTGAMEGFLQRF